MRFSWWRTSCTLYIPADTELRFSDKTLIRRDFRYTFKQLKKYTNALWIQCRDRFWNTKNREKVRSKKKKNHFRSKLAPNIHLQSTFAVLPFNPYFFPLLFHVCPTLKNCVLFIPTYYLKHTFPSKNRISDGTSGEQDEFPKTSCPYKISLRVWPTYP